MKTAIPLLLLLACIPSFSQPGSGTAQSSQPQGILQSVENAAITPGPERSLQFTRLDEHAAIKLTFKECQGLGIDRDRDQWWALPINSVSEPPNIRIQANHSLWILPVDPTSKDTSWYIEPRKGTITAAKSGSGLTVLVQAGSAIAYPAEARPHNDPFRNRFSLQITGGPELEDALASFYWGTMLPSIVEKTMAARFPYSSGYVLSTLNVQSYAGSYPAVDHEFQIKGRLAFASPLDIDVVRRMIELQFKLMNDDPEHLYRAPTSVQPDGRREYHVRRNSRDNHQNAAMFPYTGNIEVIEEAWHLYEATKDLAWLRANIANLEHAAGWTAAAIDQYGRLWSDVYYEDQVIKDGRVTQAQCFAAYTFGLLSRMESLLGRSARSEEYIALSKRLAAALVTPLPEGYWDENNQRFIDWVDRNGKVHDHVHLLANALPVMFGYASAKQSDAVRRLIAGNAAEFELFPSFLSPHIDQYTKTEIGDGGPYDLSAAGRYWYWDAAFRQSQNEDATLLQQLMAVAAEGRKNGYFMGERYDMDHVYYVDGKDAHGAEKYYEYPNVFSAVLISEYIGLTVPNDADVAIMPHIQGYGSIEFDQPAYALRYTLTQDEFTLKNLAARPRRFKVDLSAVEHRNHYRLQSKLPSSTVAATTFITLGPQQEARWSATK